MRDASMRPPLLAEENLRPDAPSVMIVLASMRPPLLAEENDGSGKYCCRRTVRFNEASAVSGGKRIVGERRGCGHRCFNEASAVSGGKRKRSASSSSHDGTASMRPPLLAEENAAELASLLATIDASMRPPLLAEENLRGRCDCMACSAGFNEASAVSGGKPADALDDSGCSLALQ